MINRAAWLAGSLLAVTALSTILLGRVGTGRKSAGASQPKLASEILGTASYGSEPIQPITLPAGLDPRKVELGRALFMDKRLSADNSVSCASCHNLRAGGVDGLPVSVGIRKQRASRNAPTVYNCSLNYRQFWDGRVATLEDQIDGPVQAPKEMGTRWEDVVAKLSSDKACSEQFLAIYPEGVSRRTIKDAIAVFERSLMTPDSRFDQYLKGDVHAINKEELEGYKLFKSLGCVACHQGANVGGNMMQPFGVMEDPGQVAGDIAGEAKHGKSLLGDLKEEDTEARSEQPVFKVPGLRNVAITGPYFHDGSATSLSVAIRVMAGSQLSREISSKEVSRIQAFLGTLTGKQGGGSL